MQQRCGDMVQTSLWLLSAKQSLKKVFAWLKKNWQLVAGFCFATTLFILARGKFDIAEYLEKIREGYNKEIDSINKSHERELKKREDALNRKEDSIREVEDDFDRKIINLEERKKEIADKALEDEDANKRITDRLSDITGIDIHE